MKSTHVSFKDVKKHFHSEINQAKDHESLAEALARCLGSVVAVGALKEPEKHNGKSYIPMSVEWFTPQKNAENKEYLDLSYLGEQYKGCYMSVTTFVVVSGVMKDPLHLKAFENMLPEAVDEAALGVLKSISHRWGKKINNE